MSFDAAAETAGFFLAHAVWCVSEGGPLIPMVGFVKKGERGMNRFVSEKLEDGVANAKRWAVDPGPGIDHTVCIFDAFVTIAGRRTDALICEVRRGAASLEIILPYRPDPFAVYKPKFTDHSGLDDGLDGLGEALFRGVDAHEQGSAVWNQHLDQSF